jgi:putative transposase
MRLLGSWGHIEGRSAIHIARVHAERRRNFLGRRFGERGYFLSIVGRYEEAILQYISRQELEDARLEPLNSWRRREETAFMRLNEIGAAPTIPQPP